MKNGFECTYVYERTFAFCNVYYSKSDFQCFSFIRISEYKPSYNSFSIQVVYENLWWTRDFEIFE